MSEKIANYYKTDWAKVCEIIINIFGIGLPYLIKTLLNKNK